MATFRVARASEYLAISGWGVDDVKVAKKAWVWLGVQRCKTLHVSPVSFELDAHGITSESFPIFVRVHYIVGPKIDAGSGGSNKKPGAGEDPLLLYAKLVAPSRSKKDACSKSHVKKLVQGVLEGHIGVVAAGMTAEQIFVKGAGRFMKEVQDRVQVDLVGKFGIQVYYANVKMLQVGVPASMYLARQKTQPGAAGRKAVKPPATKKVEKPKADKVSKAAVANNAQQKKWNAVMQSTQKAVLEELFERLMAVDKRGFDVIRFFEQEVPKTLSVALDSTSKAVAGLLSASGEKDENRQAGHRFLEQEIPRIASMALDRTRRAFTALVGGDDETSATQQQVPGVLAAVQEQTGAAATEGVGNAN